MAGWLKDERIPKAIKIVVSLLSSPTDPTKLAEAVVDLIELIQGEIPDPTDEQIARAFWESALVLAMVRALDEDGIGRAVDHRKAARAAIATLKPILETADAPDPNAASNPDFDWDKLSVPTRHPLYPPLRAAFPAFVRGIHAACEVDDDELLGRRLDHSLPRAVHRVWRESGNQRFREAVERQNSGPTAEGLRRWRAWQRHYDWIERPLDQEPLLLQPEDSPITLRAVYTPLRCAWHEVVPVEGAGGATGKRLRFDESVPEQGSRTRRIAHVAWLEETVRDWLKKDDRQDAVRVIAGGPGSGKTSFARLLASAIGREGGWHVAFVRLQWLTVLEDLDMALKQYFARPQDGAGLEGNPFDWQSTDETPILLVLDGLDELARNEETASKLASQFVLQASSLTGKHNHAAVRVKILILGRSAAVSEAVRMAHLTRTAVLHVMPLGPLDEYALGLQRSRVEQDSVDAADLVGIDQRSDYWDRWCRASGERAPLAEEVLNLDGLRNLSVEPLLFYFLIETGRATGGLAEQTDRNRVYEDIFRMVHERDREKPHASSHGQDEKTFFLLMECLGLAVWHGGGRTGSDEDFRRLGERYVGGRWERVWGQRGDAQKDVQSVAVQFYTRGDIGRDNPGFEFLHKTFGEYLVGRAVLRAADRWESEADRDFAAKWSDLTGVPELTDEIVDFLRVEALHYVAENRARAVALKDRLVGVFSWALRYGFPTHQAAVECWKETEQRQRNATGTLLAVLNALARAVYAAPAGKDDPGASQASLRIAWPDGQSPRRLTEFLHITGGEHSAHRRLLGHLDLSGADLSEAHLREAHLSEADLSEANLRGANLSEADLSGASLSEANLRGANLSEADLSGANLRGAHLSEANLSEANLRGADLREAHLREAHLRGAHLSEADLREAHLREAHLRGADLIRADLRGADLSEANLSEAHLSEADLRGANLREANLREAHLREADMRGADLRGADLRGAHLSEANLSEANLRGADLRGADLRWANLRGANLSEAHLREAELREANLSEANLSEADLSEAHLRGANLSEANLSEADLRGANLSEADLRGANLSEADLREANLREADLRGANLSEADLSGANLSEADLSGAHLREAHLSEANLRGANLSEVIPQETSAGESDHTEPTLSQTQCDAAFGDGATRLPKGCRRPDHWPDAVLGFMDAHRAWRAWREGRE